jgi:hypothetical protein
MAPGGPDGRPPCQVTAWGPNPDDRAGRDRAVATRDDTLAVRYPATVSIAAINEWR